MLAPSKILMDEIDNMRVDIIPWIKKIYASQIEDLSVDDFKIIFEFDEFSLEMG
jgi:hypothetical protein